MSLYGNLSAVFNSIDTILNFSFPLFEYNISIYEILFFGLVMSFLASLMGFNFKSEIDDGISRSKAPTREEKIKAEYFKRQKWLDEYKSSKK